MTPGGRQPDFRGPRRLPDPPLLLVTDRKQARVALVELVDRAGAAGCRWFSLREKDLPAGEQIALALALKPVAQRYGARLTLHGDAALAKQAGLDGVHLPAAGDPAAARALLGTQALVGVSVHGAAEAQALDVAVDYAIAGPAYETASKPGYGPAMGAAGVAALCRASGVPILAIGGIVPSVVAHLMLAGAAGIAVMGAVMRTREPGAEVGHLLAALADGRRRALAVHKP